MKKKENENIKQRKKPNIDIAELEDSAPKRKVKKKEKKKRKSRFKRKLFFFFFLLLIGWLCFMSYRLFIFKELAYEMFRNTPSIVYDSNKNVIAQIGSERNRENIEYDKLPSNLVNAYISIEDQRYLSHHGVDIKRTSAAILSYITNRGSSSFGGSTITQQLAKNLTGDDANSINRKVNEWFYAWTLNAFFSKEAVLEAYFNIIYTGPNIYGVQMASQYYFSKDVQNLSLAESAFLAGLNNSPNSYNPFTQKDNTEKIKKRTSTVLKKMLELNYISQTDYDLAIEEVENGLKFSKGSIQNKSTIYSYHTDALINEAISDLSKIKHISKEFATNYFYLSGSKIYSTQNSSLQAILEKESENKQYIIQSHQSEDTSQSAFVLIDHSSGKVIACTGGLGKKTTSRCFNRATQMKRQTGSAMKPIAVLAPGIDKKIITNSSLVKDEPQTFIDYNNKPYSPIDYDAPKGTITLRQAVESSQNIPFVRIMEEITPEVSIKYLKKMGITTLNENDVNLSLALGGLDQGISPLEFAGAYESLANDGIYIEPTFYTKISSYTEKTILESKQKTRKVISKDVACVLKHLLTEPVKGSSGTATYCNIPNISVAAKTGTTNDNYDRWLCGFTPYYTAVCWYGFDTNETIEYGGKNPAGLIWASTMTKIHEKLPSAQFEITPRSRKTKHLQKKPVYLQTQTANTLTKNIT